MKALERIDEELPSGVIFTKKVMDNGEIRSRIKMPDGTIVTHTKAKDWSLGVREMPWQTAHLHEGLTEVYTQMEGWSAYIWKDGKDGNEKLFLTILRDPGVTVTFLPQVPHVVLLGPNAFISTQLFGDTVGNPNRKGNDWWPVTEEFAQELIMKKQALEKIIRGSMA